MRSTLYDEYISYPLFTLQASAARYSSTATGADQPRRGKFLKPLSALHH